MVLTISIGVEVKFDGNGFLKIEIPKAYYGKVKKTSGSLRRGVSLQGAGCPTEESLPRMGKSCRVGMPFSSEWKGGANHKCSLPSQMRKIPLSSLPTQTCGVCGNFNGEEEDELLMPNDELAPDDITYVDSWQDKEIDPR